VRDHRMVEVDATRGHAAVFQETEEFASTTADVEHIVVAGKERDVVVLSCGDEIGIAAERILKRKVLVTLQTACRERM
jgi:hypothetical protein